MTSSLLKHDKRPFSALLVFVSLPESAAQECVRGCCTFVERHSMCLPLWDDRKVSKLHVSVCFAPGLSHPCDSVGKLPCFRNWRRLSLQRDPDPRLLTYGSGPGTRTQTVENFDPKKSRLYKYELLIIMLPQRIGSEIGWDEGT